MNPLAVQDIFGNYHVEPSVTGTMLLETIEPVRTDFINDLFLISNFGSGKPNTLTRFKDVAILQGYHDPLRRSDVGVALAKMAKTAMVDTPNGVYGAADIITCRPGSPTQSSRTIKAGATSLLRVDTGDYGSQTRLSKSRVAAGSLYGRKLTLTTVTGKVYAGDNLGPLFSVEYTGNGNAAALTIRRDRGVITYVGQAEDGDYLTINGVVFEFDTGDGVSQGRVAVDVGADKDTTFANLAAAIAANCPGTIYTQDTTAGTLLITDLDDGVVIVLGQGLNYSVAAAGAAAFLDVEVTASTDGSANLQIPLTYTAYASIGQLVDYISSQLGYSATLLPGANRFLSSTLIDTVTNQSVLAAPYTLTGYNGAIADWVNSRTQGNFIATILAPGTPDIDAADVAFTGGTTPPITVTDIDDALTLIATKVQTGGIILVNSTDPVVMELVETWIIEQESAGKFFRAYHATEPALSAAAAKQIAGGLSHRWGRLCCQRGGVLASDGSVTYLDPIYLTAALAGGAAGNRPWVNPLTERMLRFADIHPDDDYDLETREDLLSSGVTVLKRDQDVIVVALHVTTSHDPEKRMPRIASEADTAALIDADVRQNFLQFRGRWVNIMIAARVLGVLGKVLRYYVTAGAIMAGVDDNNQARDAYNIGQYDYKAGVLKLAYQVFMGGELDHISEVGSAEYQRVTANLTGGSTSFTTQINLAA
jgi:hypothetical protein